MPITVTLECPDCGLQWIQRKTHRNQPYEKCPVCSVKATPQLSAPSLNRGAQPETSIKVPDGKSKQIDFAMRMIADDHKVTNMKDKSTPGESLAIPVPVQPGLEPKWNGAQAAKSTPVTIQTAEAIGRANPQLRQKMNNWMDLGATNRKPWMKPIYK